MAIVVNPDFAGALAKLAARLHVWICATAANRQAAEVYRQNHPNHSLETGVTVFSVGDQASAEDRLLEVLSDVDLHHGQDSHDPPWDRLEIYGVAPTPGIRAALAAYDVTDFAPTPDGFTCQRARSGAA